MLLKILIISLSLYIYVENQEIKVCPRDRSEDSSIASDFVKSMFRFKNKLTNIFRLTIGQYTSKIEKRRRKIKKAFHTFVNEAIYDKTNSTKDKLVTYRLADLSDEAIEESKMSTIQLVLHHGYQVEAHTVQTRDGYMLRLHRILPIYENSTVVKNGIVILHHGLMGSSDEWLLLGPNEALPYLLRDAGFDVWLTNARGNKYSRFMTSFLDNSSEFWDFSFHEMGTVDLPAVIDYVKIKSESDSDIDFVGFSMGATALLVLLSSLPQYNQVLKSATLLAPLAFMYQIKGPLKLLAEFHGENARNSLNFLGVNEFMSIETFPSPVIEKYCRGGGRLCRNPLLLIANGGKEIRNKKILGNVLGHLPAGASTKTIVHFVQLVNSGQFRMYDYGASNNWKKYGQQIPPRYNLSSISLPIVLFSSFDDWLSTNANILRLLPLLPNVAVHHVIRHHNFSHTDFIWGEDASNLVFQLVVEILGQLSEKNINLH